MDRYAHEFEHTMGLKIRKTSLWITVMIISEIRKKKYDWDDDKSENLDVKPGDTFDEGHHDSIFLYHVWAVTHCLGMKGTQKSPESR
jgi:hypothetical protein